MGGRSARVRAAVLEATLGLLIEQEAFSIPQVALRAGVHETSIYRRWGTREALIVDAIASRMIEEIPVPDTGTLRGDLVALLERSVAFQSSPIGRQMMRASAIDPSGRELDVRRAYWPERLRKVGVIFERAIARGEIPPSADVALATELLIAPLHFRALVSHEPFDDRLAERLADFVLRGVRPSPSAPLPELGEGWRRAPG
jgi:AcrR family transcriptional regulator